MSSTRILYTAFVVVWLGGAIVMFIRQRGRAQAQLQAVFPEGDPVHPRFWERGASGRSLQSLRTRLGGASNCLEVIVTEGELWMRLGWPFRFLFTGAEYDVLHRVRRDQVCLVQQDTDHRRRRVLLEFIGADGRVHRVELQLRAPEAFVGALAGEQHKAT